MSVQDLGTIDYLAIESGTGRVVIAVSDHLDWKEATEHLYTLQEKLNSYIAFVEGGQVWKEASVRAGRNIAPGSMKLELRVYLLHQPPELFYQFLAHVQEAVAGLGLSVRHQVRAAGDLPTA